MLQVRYTADEIHAATRDGRELGDPREDFNSCSLCKCGGVMCWGEQHGVGESERRDRHDGLWSMRLMALLGHVGATAPLR